MFAPESQQASTSTSQRLPSLQPASKSSKHSRSCADNTLTPPLSQQEELITTRSDLYQDDVDAKQSNFISSSRRRARRSSSSVAQLVMLLVALVTLSWTTTPARAENDTSLTGTWSSGAGHVMTGLDFFNPITKNFTIPASGGVAYSFIDDMEGGGHFETSTFTFTSNPSSNRCFTATLTWQHGTYTVNKNGSLSLTPYAPDGVVQVMDPCGATSIAQYSYNEFELIPYWYNYIESDTGFGNGTSASAYAMGMYNNNGTGGLGARKNIMNLVNRPPTMLPTEQLHEEILNSVSA